MTSDKRAGGDLPADEPERQADAAEEVERQQRYSRYAAERQARIDAEWERERIDARNAWIANGGTEASFEEEWPAMKADMMRRRDTIDKERHQREFKRILRGRF
jgi:hypothetical protein